jgi:metallophosphoesterase superfamily enzyme
LQAFNRNPIPPPAVTFWTNLGGACVLALDAAKKFFRNELLDLLRKEPSHVDAVLRRQAEEVGTKTLLHISDLHFGDRDADRSRRYLKSHFDLNLEHVDRVVVTGDLFNTPDPALRDQFLDFKTDIERMTDKPLIVIPGNHDVRTKGNVVRGITSQTYEFIVDIGFHPLVIDDELACIFFCFNSVEEGNLARGSVSDAQLERMATSFNEEIGRGRRRRGTRSVGSYTRIALVHHHPYAYETVPTAGYDTFLRRVTGNEDTFTRFDHADRFITWCAEMNVSLILHGHKHVPHHVQADVDVAGRTRTMVIVGCGSTTGTENSPRCYDEVSLNPETGRWGVTFYYDASNAGAGFRVQEMTIDTRRTEPAW